jgi:hypothetical protein
VESELDEAFKALREEWAQLSREFARMAAAPYDPPAVAAHLEKLRRHRARLRFLRSALRDSREHRAVH